MEQNNHGVLLINIGTPDAATPSAVRRYLREFLSDPRVVQIPRLLWWPILYGIILPIRARKSAALYQKIWTEEGSPLFLYTKKMAEKLKIKLNIPVEFGMHYGNPSIQTALESLRAQGVNKLSILPLYPQYSSTTTASSFDHIAALFKKWNNLPSLHFQKHYADHPHYIDALTQSIERHWQEHTRAPFLLFSFHGIPERYVKAGDPYFDLCQLTARLVSEKLHLKPQEWSLSFQSRLGKAAWLSPYTEQVLKQLPQQNIKHVQVICPGFATDCLETLEEIALRGKEQFLSAGGEKFGYIPALNDHETQINLMAQIVML